MAWFEGMAREFLLTEADRRRCLKRMENLGKSYYPTRRQYRTGVQAARARRQAGDQVVIQWAARSQKLRGQDSLDPEPDGLDDIFLPADVGPWNGSKGPEETPR